MALGAQKAQAELALARFDIILALQRDFFSTICDTARGKGENHFAFQCQKIVSIGIRCEG